MSKLSFFVCFLFLGTFYTSAQPCFSVIDTVVKQHLPGAFVTDSNYRCFPFVIMNDGNLEIVDMGISFDLQTRTIYDSIERDSAYSSYMLTFNHSAPNFITASTFDPAPPYFDEGTFIRLDMDGSSFDSSSLVSIKTWNFEVAPDGFYDQVKKELHLLCLVAHNPDTLHSVWRIIDSLGNVIQEVELVDSRTMRANTISPVGDGGVILSYQFFSASTFWDTGMVRLAPDGTIVWRKEDVQPGFPSNKGVIALSDGSFIHIYDLNNGATMRLEQMDHNGERIKFWPSLPYYESAPSFHLLKDGCLMVLYSHDNGFGKHPTLTKYDPFGNILWTKKYHYNDNYGEQLRSFAETPDGGYFLTGTTRDTILGSGGWLLKTDCNGDICTVSGGSNCTPFDCTAYPISANMEISDTLIDLAVESGVVQFENDSPFATNRIWQFDDGKRDETGPWTEHTFTENGIYDVKLTVYVGQCQTSQTQQVHVINALELEERMFDENDLLVYPNPSNSGKFTFESRLPILASWQVHNSLGQLVHQSDSSLNGTSKQDIYLQHQKPGTYLLNIELVNGQRVTKRIVII
jgi:hypothetical protein